MRAEVIREFYDLTTGKGCVPDNTYHVGDVYEGSAARIAELEGRGFVKKLPTRKRAAKPKAKQ